MVLRETQRAFVYFSLHGLTVDCVIVARVLPPEVRDTGFSEWNTAQDKVLKEIEESLAPVAIKRVPLFAHEVLGKPRLEDLARVLYAEGEDPAAVIRTEKPYTFGKRDGIYEVQMLLPFAAKSEIGVFKKGDELVVGIGSFRRRIGLPRSMAVPPPVPAEAKDRGPTLRM